MVKTGERVGGLVNPVQALNHPTLDLMEHLERSRVSLAELGLHDLHNTRQQRGFQEESQRRPSVGGVVMNRN